MNEGFVRSTLLHKNLCDVSERMNTLMMIIGSVHVGILFTYLKSYFEEFPISKTFLVDVQCNSPTGEKHYEFSFDNVGDALLVVWYVMTEMLDWTDIYDYEKYKGSIVFVEPTIFSPMISVIKKDGVWCFKHEASDVIVFVKPM